MLTNPEGVNDNPARISTFPEPTEAAAPTVEGTEQTEKPETTENPIPEGGLKPTEAEAPETEGKPEPRTFKAKLDGKEIEFEVKSDDVDLESLPTSLMMSHTFYEKTRELAEERKAFEAKAQEVDAQLSELRSQLDYSTHQLESDEMKALKEEDPSLYWEKYGELKEKQDRYQSYISKRQEEAQKAHQDLVQKEIKNWEFTVPEWQNPEVKKKETGELYNYLIGKGLTPDQVSGLYDSTIVAITRNSMLYEKAQQKQFQSTKQPDKHVKSNSTATAKPVEKTLAQTFYGDKY